MRAFASGGKCDEFERRKTNLTMIDWEKCTREKKLDKNKKPVSYTWPLSLKGVFCIASNTQAQLDTFAANGKKDDEDEVDLTRIYIYICF